MEEIKNFKFWCQKVLPLVYDDSLSYYEVLCKIQKVLNDLIKNNNNMIDYLKQFQNWIDSQLQIYTNEKMEEWLNDGTIENLLNVEKLNQLKQELLTKIQQVNTNLTKSIGLIKIIATDYGFVDDGITDNISAFNNVKTLFPNLILYFPIKSIGKYYFSGGRPLLNGIRIETQEGVSFKLDANPNLKEMSLLSPLIIENTVHLTTLTKHKNLNYDKVLNNIGSSVSDIISNEEYFEEDLTTWENKIHDITTNDTSLNGTSTKTKNVVLWATAFTGNPQFIKPTVVKENTCYEINGTSGVGNTYGMMIKTDQNKVIRIQNVVGNSLWEFVQISPNVVDKRFNIKTPNGGAYGMVQEQQQNIQIYYENSKSIYFMVSDFTLYHYKGDIGLVTEIGFVLVNSSSTNNFSFVNALRIENYKYQNSKPLKIALIGDSVMYGAWNSLPPEKILPIMLQNINGIGQVEVTNYSISGRSTVEWSTDINNYNFNGFEYVIIMLGTNDQQGGISISTYKNNLKTISDKVKGDNSTPLFMVFPIFTNSTNSGVKGVTTNNYSNHAIYTQALKMFCLQNGYNFGNARRKFGSNLKWYGDNIHPSEEGQISILASIAELISRVRRKITNPH